MEWHKGSWTSRTATLWWRAMELHTFPKLAKLPVEGITSTDIYGLVSNLLNEKSYDTAKRVRQGISTVMEQCVRKGYRSDNPAALVKLPKNTKPKRHHRSVHYTEAGEALTRIQQSGAWKATKLLIEFGLLTTVRPTEARLATWDEVDMQAGLWCVPGERMKERKAHTIPLSTRAIEILQEAKQLTGNTGLIFESPNGGAISDDTSRKLLERNGLDATPHGFFRSCFRSWTADNGVPFDVAEMCLAHKAGPVVEAYQRSDMLQQRRALMEQWAEYIATGTCRTK